LEAELGALHGRLLCMVSAGRVVVMSTWVALQAGMVGSHPSVHRVRAVAAEQGSNEIPVDGGMGNG
jgi:hypothetical protein